jgi:hypothetical protein
MSENRPLVLTAYEEFRLQQSLACQELHARFFLSLFFDPQDGGDVPQKRQLTLIL